MYEDDDLFDIGPILGKGYPEFNDKQPRGKDGKWVRGGGGGSKSPKGGGRKPASKPKTTAKPKAKAPAKKPVAKPKTPAKKPRSKPKTEAQPVRKPRTRKPKTEVAAQEQPVQPGRQSTALVPSHREEPIDVQAESVPERPSGLIERDRKTLEDQYGRYDALNSEIDSLTRATDSMQTRADRIYDELSRATGERVSRSLNDQLNTLDDQILRNRSLLARRTSERDTLRSSIEGLEARLRGQKRYISKLFNQADTAIDFKTAFNKIVPDNGQPPGNDVSGNPLGLVFGWAIVCKERGHPYFDTQGDHIPEDSMLKAATDFMMHKRDLKVMHKGKRVGTVVFAWPVTKDIAKAMGLDGTRTGLMIGVKPDNPTIMDRFRDGQYTGFSIGGNRLIDEPVT